MSRHYERGEHITLLATRGPVDQEAPRRCECHEVLAWLERHLAGHNQYGHDRVKTWLLRRCADGAYAVLVQKDWCPAPGYSAEGTQEDIYLLAPEAQPAEVTAS